MAESEERLFPVVKRRTPLLDLFRQKVGVRSEDLTEEQKRLAEDFKLGISSALGVPPEAIRQDLVEKWVINWTRAMVKPEFWKRGRYFGQELGRILSDSLPSRSTGLIADIIEKRTGTSEPEKTRHSDISVG